MCTYSVHQITLHISVLLHLPSTAGFEESGVSDAEGLLAMMHQRYPDVSVRGGSVVGVVYVM